MTGTIRPCLLLPLVALLGACTPLTTEQEPAFVECLTKKLTEDQGFAAGLAAATPSQSAPGLKPSMLQALTCADGLAYAWNPQAYPQVGEEYGKAVQKLPSFKQGLYAAASPVKASPQTQRRVGEIGVFMEGVAVARRDFLACNPANRSAVDLVAQLDETFALAALGRYAGIDSVEAAGSTAVALGQRVQATGQTLPAQECSAEVESRYLADVKTFATFYEGTHPWAPGCRVTTDTDAFVLKCEDR